MSTSTTNINPIDLKDPKDSLTIAEEKEMLSTNIYQIASYVDTLKKKYMDIPNDTLAMGLFGYISELGTNILENSSIMAAEYSNEALPTRAKFERNIICHALSLGIDKIRATPARMEVYLGFPEDRLIANMVNDEFIIDKNFPLNIGNGSNTYTYRIEYDIKIRRNKLPNGKWIYTATYLTDTVYDNGVIKTNEISNIVNPYLPAVATTRISDNSNVVLITATVVQTNHRVIEKKILVDNPLETKSLTFTFPDQLAYFYVEVTEHTKNGDSTKYLKCLYDGLYNTENAMEYCNYQYIDDSTIRIVFNRDSYQPRTNVDVTVHVYTTKGDECNFKYNTITYSDLTSDRFSYNNIIMLLIPQSDSDYGINKKSVDELKAIIPKQMLMRSSISTYTDLNNFFNTLNTDDVRLYFLQKIHNQIQRIFFCYMLMKDNNNMIIPTNTVDVNITKDMFSNINRDNFILPAGSTFYLDYNSDEAVGVIPSGTSSENNTDLKGKDASGFLYFNPFLTVINKNPFLLNYYLNILEYSKTVSFDYINDESELQFICNTTGVNPVRVKKPFFPASERDTYSIELILTQNISSDYGMIVTDKDGHIIKNNMRVIGVFYKDTDHGYEPYRYTEGILEDGDYDDLNFSYTYKFKFHTNNVINKDIRICIDKGLNYTGSTTEATTYLPNNVKFKIFILAKFEDDSYGTLQANNTDEDDISAIVPGLTEQFDSDGNKISNAYTLCNIYEINTGLDLFVDYSNIMESYTYVTNSASGALDFHAKRMPLVRYGYFWDFGNDSASDTAQFRPPTGLQDRVSKFIQALDYRRIYIQSSLMLLEDSFGVDFKFFNTYGPSKLYSIEYKDHEKLIDRVNLSLTFEVKYQSIADMNCKNDIISYIKQYMENINYITDLHMPNLVTAIKNKFFKQIVYIKFVGLNHYGYMYQSIYDKNVDRDAYTYSTTVPEFLNVNITKDPIGNDTPDVTLIDIT